MTKKDKCVVDLNADNEAIRQIVIDTETTGLHPSEGHRIIEIGAIEMINRKLTGKTFHHYINPLRDIDKEAQSVHGISREDLKDKPLFHEISDEFINFIKGAELIIHNAPFDIGFLNAELLLSGEKSIDNYAIVFDTLVMAKERFPSQRNNLDALCKRFGVNNTKRTLHGALLDSEILCDVFLLMSGGQFDLLDEEVIEVNLNSIKRNKIIDLRVIHASEGEMLNHHNKMTSISKNNGLTILF